jgi:hypothetical protein
VATLTISDRLESRLRLWPATKIKETNIGKCEIPKFCLPGLEDEFEHLWAGDVVRPKVVSRIWFSSGDVHEAILDAKLSCKCASQII